MSRRQPILPKSEKGWTEDANGYRKVFHEDIYPKNQEWVPTTGLLTAGSFTGSYVRMGRISVFSVVMQGPVTVNSGGYFDLPMSTSQAAVFSVAESGNMRAALVAAGASRVYLPAFGPVGSATISGTIVS